MKTVDICRKPAITAKAGTPLVELARLMRSSHVGSVVVVADDGANKPLGIVTDRDIVVEVVAMGLDVNTLTAGDIMTQSPAVSGADEDVLRALKVMRDRGVRRLPVVDASGELAGMLAFDDVMQHLGGSIDDMAQMLGTQRSVEQARRG